MRPRFLARGYYVFNEAQVDGHVREELPCLPTSERLVRADAFFAGLNNPIVTGGNDACYRPDIDTIFMPPFEHFLDAASFYSCLGHEAAHGTGHPSRLNRDLTGRYGSAAYAMDEVVAELTSSFVLADLGIANRPRAEHAAYISSWIKALRSDARAIFTAAGKAQHAADWMHAQHARHGSSPKASGVRFTARCPPLRYGRRSARGGPMNAPLCPGIAPFSDQAGIRLRVLSLGAGMSWAPVFWRPSTSRSARPADNARLNTRSSRSAERCARCSAWPAALAAASSIYGQTNARGCVVACESGRRE